MGDPWANHSWIEKISVEHRRPWQEKHEQTAADIAKAAPAEEDVQEDNSSKGGPSPEVIDEKQMKLGLPEADEMLTIPCRSRRMYEWQ